MILSSAEGIANAWVLMHGRPVGAEQTERLVAFVQAKDVGQIAAWLETLAEPGTVAAACYAEAARKLRNHEHVEPTAPR